MKPETVRQWIIKAENDLKICLHELENNDPVTDAICFHAQQCVGKYLKAFLVFHDQIILKTHNLSAILKGCIDIDVAFNHLKEVKADELTMYATEFRYPDDFYIPSIVEAKKAVELALEVKRFVLGKVK